MPVPELEFVSRNLKIDPILSIKVKRVAFRLGLGRGVGLLLLPLEPEPESGSVFPTTSSKPSAAVTISGSLCRNTQ